jgi:hypothetical protein
MKHPVLMFVTGLIFGGLIAYFAIVLLLFGGGGELETTAVVDEKSSPDGTYIARAEKRTYADGRCENRTTLTGAGVKPDWSRNYVFNIGCSNPINLAWTGNRELLIQYEYNKDGEVHVSRQFRSEDTKVTIRYFLQQ